MANCVVIVFTTETGAFSGENYEAEVARVLGNLSFRANYTCRGKEMLIFDANGVSIGKFRSIEKD